MNFEWDDDKAAANVRKHNVAFELAERVWDDPAHIIVFDRHENGEERWHAIGLVRGILILTV
ncbi:MAG: BrnT family toxin, partial [Sphingobium sp.]